MDAIDIDIDIAIAASPPPLYPEEKKEEKSLLEITPDKTGEDNQCVRRFEYFANEIFQNYELFQANKRSNIHRLIMELQCIMDQYPIADTNRLIAYHHDLILVLVAGDSPRTPDWGMII